MVTKKLTPNQQRRVDTILAYQGVVSHVRHLVSELDSNRAANAKIIDGLCAQIARELSQLRQKAISAPVGTLGDVAGSLAVLAARGGSGMTFKLRGLHDGIASMNIFLDQALKAAMQPEKDEKH